MAVYTIFSATNSTDWVPLSTNVALAGSVLFTDVAATNNSKRFYAATVGAQSTIILEQNTVGGNKTDIRLNKPGAQSFREGVAGGPSYTISKIVLYLSREATAPSANLILSIGTGVNSGAFLSSIATINPLSISNTTAGTTFQAYEIVYGSPVGPLAAGTTYYLNVANDAPNDKRVYLERSNGAGYANGTYYKDGTDQGFDIKFDLWGQ